MSESDEWWRAHLDEDEEVIWHGGIRKDGMAQPFRAGFWVTVISGEGGLVFGVIMLLTDSDDAWKMLILGTASVALSFVFKKANRLVREKVVFAVAKDRVVSIVDGKGIAEELPMNAFVHFSLEGNDIDFPRDIWRWRDLEHPENAYEALKQAQRPYL